MTARSGRHMIKACLEKLGYTESDYNMNDLYARFLKLADKKGQVYDYDLEALLFFTKVEEETPTYQLDRMNVMCGNGETLPDGKRPLARGQTHPHRVEHRERSGGCDLQLHHALDGHSLLARFLLDQRQR